VLLSRNDVGFDPEQFSAPPEDFHLAGQQRRGRFPGNLLATATHDHKRGEDSRARLSVLSERSAWYAAHVTHWMALAEGLRGEFGESPAPTGGDEAMLYQALLGAWPLGLEAEDEAGLQALCERVAQWQQKALREAKLLSSWSAPNEPYEALCKAFLEKLLLDDGALPLRQSMASAVRQLAAAGALNSLAQSLLRMTVPGVPDLYQGAEYWDFSLVDPDNRRPVDYAARQQSLSAAQGPAQLLEHWQDGHIKQALVARTLHLRSEYAELFLHGDYQPLEVHGEHANKVLAFARTNATQRAIVIVPRLCSDLLGEGSSPLIDSQKWGDTHIKLPNHSSLPNLKGLFSDLAVTPDKELRLSTALQDFPVNLFVQSDQ
jgi:(1->4)-alpha-D-glucan 1-alpha-D-glucosylmutase